MRNMKEVDKIEGFPRLLSFQIILFPLIDYFYMTCSHFKKSPDFMVKFPTLDHGRKYRT